MMKYLITFLYQLSCHCGYYFTGLVGLFNNKKCNYCAHMKMNELTTYSLSHDTFFQTWGGFQVISLVLSNLYWFPCEHKAPSRHSEAAFVARCEHTLSPACRHDMTWAVPSHSSSINFNLIESLSGKAGLFLVVVCEVDLTFPWHCPGVQYLSEGQQIQH